MNQYVIAGDCTQILPTLQDKSIDTIICDPPYDAHTHQAQRRGATGYTERPSKRAQFNRVRHLGFEPLSDEVMKICAQQFARVTKRWVLIFCTFEMVADWKRELVTAGLDYVRCGVWVKKGSTPQFSGDRPATGAEAIIIAHPKGRKKWNGRGSHGVWTYPIVLNRSHKNPRLHTAQKPLDLMRRLVELFSNPDELILDPFCGAASTGCAALELGRRFIGYELEHNMASIAEKRIVAHLQTLSSASATMAGCSTTTRS